MLSLHIWVCTQHGMAFLWRAIEIFVDNLPGTICIKIYRDEIAFDIYLCFLLLFLLVSRAFHSLLIIFQALMLVHTFSPNKSVFVLTKPVRQRQSKCSFYKCQIHFSAFFMYFSIKSTCWNFLFKSILVLREFNACCKVEFALSNFRMTYLCVLAFSFFHSVSFVPFH